MSAALYIVLEQEIPGFDPFVNGKSLSRAEKTLEELAKETGVKPLMNFFSASGGELSEFADDHGVDVKGRGSEPAEQWFPAEDGLRSVRGLLQAAKQRAFDPGVISDLKEYQAVLETAQKHGVRWHLAVDF